MKDNTRTQFAFGTDEERHEKYKSFGYYVKEAEIEEVKVKLEKEGLL